jgi:hypothetical protein
MGLFTAKDAKAISASKKNGDLEAIIQKIKEKANKGDNRLFLYENIENNVFEELKKRGFEVSIQYDRNEVLVTINW